jgi:undecaprenyl-diphosphatase
VAASLARAREFLARRLDTSTFLGLHLTLSLGVAAAGVWLFASLVDAVLDNALLVRFDKFADRMIHAQATSAGLAFFNFMSRIGSPVAMTVLAIVGALYLLMRGWPTLLVTWIGAFAGGGLIERLLKAVVHRSRPPYGTAFLNNTSFSFPSGHAMGSIIGCVMVLYVLVVTSRPSGGVRTLLYCAAAVFVILVGASRVYLGVHYPSDVVGGWTAGAAWAAVCIGVAGVVLHRRGFSLSSR